MIEDLKQISQANRLIDLESRESDVTVKGDFVGNVTGVWVTIGTMGEGIVNYNGKQYKTKTLGLASLPPGTEVELSFANGIYYSKF